MGNTPSTTTRRKPTEGYGGSAQPPSPGSPLTYGPQLAMQPMSRVPEYSSKSSADIPFTCPAQPKLVPTAIAWGRGGQHVEVEGSFDNWTTRIPLQKTGHDFTIVKLLSPGVYQYKFIVDGEWQYDPSQPAMYDLLGNVNNVIEVQEYAPENLEALPGFDPPPSPDASYAQPPLQPDDFAKEPPSMPPHLNLTLLNVPPALDAQAVLPRPLHVILNHAYVHKESEGPQEALALGATCRYKSKYITTVFYKATRPSGASSQPHGLASVSAAELSAERTMSF